MILSHFDRHVEHSSWLLTLLHDRVIPTRGRWQHLTHVESFAVDFLRLLHALASFRLLLIQGPQKISDGTVMSLQAPRLGLIRPFLPLFEIV